MFVDEYSRWESGQTGRTGTASLSVLSNQKRLRMSGLFPDTRLHTESGVIAAGSLREGMAVLTDKGPREVLAVLRMPATNDPAAAAVVLRKGALGVAGPSDDLYLAGGHRIGLSLPETEARFGDALPLARAWDLLHLTGVERLGRPGAGLVHVVLESHELMAAAGGWVESFAATPEMIGELPEPIAQGLFRACPRLRYHGGSAAYEAGHVLLNRREVLENLASADSNPVSMEGMIRGA